MNIHPDRAARGTTVPDHSEQDVTELRDDVQRILGRATHSDETASEALRDHKQAEYGFSGASYIDGIRRPRPWRTPRSTRIS